MTVRHLTCWITMAVLLAASTVQGHQQQPAAESIKVLGQRQHQQSLKGLGGEMTAEQQELLQQLQAETGARTAQRKLQKTEELGFPPGVAGFEAPKGVEVPVVPLIGSPDKPSIDVFNWMIAAKMEDFVIPAGYPFENHKVITRDGYILNMYRIPHGKHRNTEKGNKPVVLLQHGVTLSSNSFVLLNANESMAYILADAGFDVWMSNTRGNTYSRGHLLLNQWGQRYWRFSMDELALVDLPAQIDYVLKTTQAKKLAFVGHSQGCTLIYMLLAEKLDYNDKISVVVHVGPVGFIEYIRAPFLKAQPVIKSDQWLKNAPLGEFIAHRDLAPFVLPFCQYNHTFNEWCMQQMNGMFYGPSVNVPTADFVLISKTWPSSVATRNLEHWSQMHRDGKLRLQKYSFGNDCIHPLGGNFPRSFHESCNMARYGTETPPEYDLSKITAPQAFFVGSIDIMSTPEDVEEQQRRLKPGVVVAQYVFERLAHMDFVWDRNAQYKKELVELIYRFSPGTF
ncbi:Alpha/Beta hydrolase protein [Scenedesmus sp. NREL 46B-D3]|nr:Alpha/Beta hydrolase protein [Scenedesmus sp. NREL 46B-D3]